VGSGSICICESGFGLLFSCWGLTCLLFKVGLLGLIVFNEFGLVVVGFLDTLGLFMSGSLVDGVVLGLD